MRKVTAKTIAANSGFILVAETGSDDDLLKSIQKNQADIVIDFTNAESAFKNACAIIQADAHPVIGTSGLKLPEVQDLQERCAQKKLGGIIAPNFSLGAVLMMKYGQEIAKYFPNIEIIEMHHAGKQDSPSGTAIKTAEMLAKGRAKAISLKPSRETIPGARGATYENIPIHAIRLPGVIANQEIIFGALGETLSLQHVTTDRECFMAGVVLACQKVQSLNQLVYGLENIL
jgi:4-hydroxy-tetrahydrodipicolinate reductase